MEKTNIFKQEVAKTFDGVIPGAERITWLNRLTPGFTSAEGKLNVGPLCDAYDEANMDMDEVLLLAEQHKMVQE